MTPDPAALYPALTQEWVRRESDRPYIAINMVATIDGKIVSGKRGEPVHDLGSEFDHRLMRVLQTAADAVLIGAASQRSSSGITYPSHLTRMVVTKSGKLNFDSRFFSDHPQKVVILCPSDTALSEAPPGVRVFRSPGDRVDWLEMLKNLRTECSVQRLLVEGGSEVNGQLLRLNCVDELFLTVAPKIRLGDDLPTYAGGPPLNRDEIQSYHLVSTNKVGDEMFIRYRRIWN